jgi:kynurenine formamidase
MEIIDLTRILDASLSIYTEGDYTDPPLKIKTWCTIQEQGYKVSHLSMGTQTGTHIDAPAHFLDGGATLEALPVQALIEPYLWVGLDQATQAELETLEVHLKGETILFLASTVQAEVEITQEVFEALLRLPCSVWAITNGMRIFGQEAFYFNRALAEAGKYLIEDLDESAAKRVKPGGRMIALPLRLTGVTGSPCRVVVLQD